MPSRGKLEHGQLSEPCIANHARSGPPVSRGRFQPTGSDELDLHLVDRFLTRVVCSGAFRFRNGTHREQKTCAFPPPRFVQIDRERVVIFTGDRSDSISASIPETATSLSESNRAGSLAPKAPGRELAPHQFPSRPVTLVRVNAPCSAKRNSATSVSRSTQRIVKQRDTSATHHRSKTRFTSGMRAIV
ncbi:hypothetical protein GGR23_004233 [Gellertiella hungarica]|uniref:Uncharacterized protein n=1 Tax=Gellertiella hungarica TaxID=1572859 RepID=A0A7W6J916_9HYPH|nr:hypothetical protein [Gellertiella hungarica]